MCGRAYSTYTDEELAFRFQNERSKRRPLEGFKPNWNMAPTHKVPVVLIKDGDLIIQTFRWGLIPAWAKDVQSAAKYSLINARSEEISEKRSYKAAFEKRRCIVPLSGFYEWVRPEKGTKRPFAIYLKTKEIMPVAGIWEHWESKETGDVVDSFSILTTSANKFMEKIHNRMPVILDEKHEKEWLDPKNTDVDALKKIMKPCPPAWLAAHEISTLVNSPKNNSKEVLEPIS